MAESPRIGWEAPSRTIWIGVVGFLDREARPENDLNPI
jgi:hypothetical protein